MGKVNFKVLIPLFIGVIGLGIIFIFLNNGIKVSANNEGKISESKTLLQPSQMEDKEKNAVIHQVEPNRSSEEQKQNVSAFKKELIESGIYIRLDDKLERATQENLKLIEKQIKHPVIYELDQDGELIKVIAEAGTLKEGDQ